jgi:putative ABC transport system permease protein
MTQRYRRLFDLRLGGRKRVDDEMDREIDAHIEMRIADLVRAGMSPEDARREAEARFGHFDSARRRLHAAARERDAALRQRDRLGSIVADIRYAGRQARRAPGFTALAIATLALGIGATTTIFTLVERVLLRPLPFPHAEQLVELTGLDSARNKVPTVSAADWLDWRNAGSLSSSALYDYPYRQSIMTTDSATRVNARHVTAEFFTVLGARFAIGRSFTPDEVESRTPVVVISERLWRTMFNGDPRLATPLRTANRTYSVVGVVARGQEFPAGADVWFSVRSSGMDPTRVNVNWQLIARLRPAATLERARVELSTIAQGIRASDPRALYDYGVGVRSLGDAVIGDAARYLKLLMAAVLFVLLIVCANVAAAGLARGSVRAREMAVRTSLGAGRARLVQQLLIEHAWLALLGGAIGLAFAVAAVKGILARWGGQIPRAHEVALDARVFAFSVLASLVAGTLAGLIPALRMSRVSLSAMMSPGGRTTARGGRNLAGASLVALEIALALLLLAGAGLLIRSFQSVLGRDIGFDTRVATAEIALFGPPYAQDTVRRLLYWEALLDAFGRIPGVEAVGLANWIPLGITGQGFIDMPGREGMGAGAVYRSVNQDFFRALRMPVVMGRTFDASDGPMTHRVVVINQTMASKYWPNQNPVGQLVRATSQEPQPKGVPAPWLSIIGVVGDIRTYGLETDARPEMYVYYRQTALHTTSMTALVRASTSSPTLFDEMRRAARSIDASVPIDVGTLDDRLRGTLATRTLTMSLLSGFAAAALILAALGIYGVLSYAVAQRTRELAVRSALGAQRGQLLKLVSVAGFKVVAVGMSVGIAAAFWVTRALEALLVDITPNDPVTYLAAAGVLLIASTAAILVPSLRATRLDPVIALQAE